MTDSPVKPGDVLVGKYRVDRVLGMGAMGVVVAATNIAIGQRVALKFMLPTKGGYELLHERFLREARACVNLRTQHVARVFDVGKMESGAPYIVMELLEGRDLAAVLQARGALPVADAVELVLQACEAVAEAHAAGIVHRDLKPANLFLTKGADGAPCVKVIDFGISKHTGEETKLTQDAEAMGSPLYMSPEQIRSSASVDARTDIWALAVLLYELVASKTPFHTERVIELITRVHFERPTPLAEYRPDVPPAFEQVLLQALEKDRNRRYANVALFAAALAPFTTPRAAVYAERVAAVLGERVAPARPTMELRLEPTAAPPIPAGPATATAPAVVRPSLAPPAVRQRSAALPLAVLAVFVLGLGAVGLVGWRVRGAPRGAAGPGSSMPAAEVASAERPPVVPAVPAELTAAPVGPQPTPEPTATAAPSATVPASRAAPASKGAAPRAPAPKTPAPAEPAPSNKPHKDPYAQ